MPTDFQTSSLKKNSMTQSERGKMGMHVQRQVTGGGTEHEALSSHTTTSNRSLFSSHSGIVQAKLSVNEPNDSYEQEANQVADQVMCMPDPSPSLALDSSSLESSTPIQRQLARHEAQRQAQNAQFSAQAFAPNPMHQKIVQMMKVQRQANGVPSVSPEVESNIQRMQGGGSPLPKAERTFFEERIGADFSGVKVHTDSNAIQTSRDLNARAFTVGNTIAFNSGEYQPGTNNGRRLLAHELTHVVQQTDAQPTPQLKRAKIHSFVLPALQRTKQTEAQHPIQRSEVNGPYKGNRPQPAQGTYLFKIISDSDRVVKIGKAITYQITQLNAAIQSSSSVTSFEWSVENDPNAVKTYGISASVSNLGNGMSVKLGARVPGLHVIKANVLLDGKVTDRLEYRQQVIPSSWSFVSIGANITASPLSTMADFIALVKRVENAYGKIPWQDVVTRLRKEYYPGPGGAYSGIKDALQWGDLIDEQDQMPALQVPPVAIEDIAALRKNQVVSYLGSQVDIGHLLTGVDSMNFPKVAGIFDMYDMEGPAAATWSGDVGSALVGYLREKNAKLEANKDDESKMLGYYNNLANVKDMMGDYDGIAIADMSTVASTAPLSERLTKYYIDSVEKGAKRRFHNFCASSKLAFTGSNLNDDAKARIKTQIANFAGAFDIVDSMLEDMGYALMDQSYYDNPLSGLFGPPPSQAFREQAQAKYNRSLEWFAKHFIQEVETGLATEGK